MPRKPVPSFQTISLPRFPLLLQNTDFPPLSNTGLGDCLKGKLVKYGGRERERKVSQHYFQGLVPQKALQNIQRSPWAVLSLVF